MPASAPARNRGAAEAKCELVAFLDADDQWLPDFLETVLKLRNRFPQASVWATAYSAVGENGEPLRPEFPGTAVAGSDGGLIDYLLSPGPWMPLHPSAVMVRKHALVKAGGFPIDVRCGEDWDTWIRLALRYPIAWSPWPKAVLHQDAENRTDGYCYTGVYPYGPRVAEFLREADPGTCLGEHVYQHVLRGAMCACSWAIGWQGTGRRCEGLWKIAGESRESAGNASYGDVCAAFHPALSWPLGSCASVWPVAPPRCRFSATFIGHGKIEVNVMCGICGIFRPDGAPVLADRVVRMRDAMTPRGPDGFGLVSGPGYALGHRRLSIIDLSTDGQQPMANEDVSIWVVFNGEIYNFADLRGELEQQGHRFRSRSDTEVLIHGYESWGLERLLRRIRGMFAFALLDVVRNQIHLARDPLGKKPLFFRWSDNELAFASSARALNLGLASTPAIDLAAIDDLLWNNHIPLRRTIFVGVEKVLPGHAWSLDRGGRVSELTHWRPNCYQPQHGVAEKEWLERIEDVLMTAVKRRFVADVPVGTMLSGGVDSSLVTAFAAKAMGQVKTFTVANEDPKEDESAYAAAVAEYYHTDQHVLPTAQSRPRGPAPVDRRHGRTLCRLVCH